jgi:hypothetical protein
MPRAKPSGAQCVKHGTDCAIGGGSSYRSAHCARLPRPTKWETPREAVSTDERDHELETLLIERRAAATGVPFAEAAAGFEADRLAGAKAWARLTPAQRCESLDGEDAELAALVATARATA